MFATKSSVTKPPSSRRCKLVRSSRNGWTQSGIDYLPILQALVMQVFSSRVMDVDASLSSHVALAGEMNDLVMTSRRRCCTHPGQGESQAWQDAADDGWLAQQAYISNLAQAAESFTAVKVCLLETEFARADKSAAGGMYETAIQQASN